MIDVLIIGSGIAGLSAALNAKSNNSNVLVVSKTYPTHSQSVQAQGGINAVIYDNDDSVNTHVEDTYNASRELSNKEHIKFMCEHAKDTILWLDSIGVPFNRNNDNKIAQRKFGGTKKIRTCYSSDYTGLKILHTLYDRCINENIEFKNEYFLLDLVIEDNICKGAVFFNIVDGTIEEIFAKTTILATGGYAGIYSNHTTNSYSNSGDGIAVAYRSGVELSNMEFIQFHPTTLENSNILISESARGEGGYLLNDKNERFIDELKPRDQVARAIYEKILKNEKVYLDLRHIGIKKINEVMPQERLLAFNFANVKIEDELLAITPAAHYTMGGIKTDIECKTNIKNLFACGECAEASIHGANRLGGNSLLEIVFIGKQAGYNASKQSFTICDNVKNSNKEEYKSYIDEIFTIENKINFYTLKENLGNDLFHKVGLFRTEKNILEFIENINNIKSNFHLIGITDKSTKYNKNLIDYLEFKNSIDLAYIIANCALFRKESRGSHFRLDYQHESANYNKYTSIIKSESEMLIMLEAIV